MLVVGKVKKKMSSRGFIDSTVSASSKRSLTLRLLHAV